MDRGNGAWTPGSLLDLLPGKVGAALLAAGGERRYHSGESISRPGQSAATGLLLIRSGRAKVVVSDNGERPLILAIRRPGDILGEVNLLMPRPGGGRLDISVATVEAIEPLVGIWVNRVAFQRFLESHPQAKDALLQAIVVKLREATARSVAVHCRADVRSKLASCLLEEADPLSDARRGWRQGDVVRLMRQDLAGLLGISPRTLGEHLKQLASGPSPIIATERGLIRILRQDDLVTLAEWPTARD